MTKGSKPKATSRKVSTNCKITTRKASMHIIKPENQKQMIISKAAKRNTSHKGQLEGTQATEPKVKDERKHSVCTDTEISLPGDCTLEATLKGIL